MTGSSPGTLGMDQLKQINGGFSLVELMLALFISAVMAAAILNFLAVQNKSYSVQDQVTEIQQNIRAAIDLMVKEIRMAGYDPTEKAGSGILTANLDRMGFAFGLMAFPPDSVWPASFDIQISSSNAMVFIISGSGQRRATSYDDNPSVVPVLHIEYAEGSFPFISVDKNILGSVCYHRQVHLS